MRMPSWQRMYVAVCAGVIAYSLAYVGVDYAKVAHLIYYQHERRWRWQVRPDGPIPSGYVGLWAWALVIGAVVAAVAFMITRWRRQPLSDRSMWLGLAWAMTAFVIAAGYYTWNNWP